jgi:hypothetical protein
VPNLTTVTDNKIMDHVHGKTAYTMPTLYIGLSSTTPTIAGAFTEPTIGTGGYARIVTTGASWNASASGTAANAAALAFPASSGAWTSGASALTHVCYFDSPTGTAASNLVMFAPITPTVTVNAAGVTVNFAIGALSDTQA